MSDSTRPQMGLNAAANRRVGAGSMPQSFLPLSRQSSRDLGSAPQPPTASKRCCKRQVRPMVLWLLLLSSMGLCGYFLAFWHPENYDNIGNVRANKYLSYGPIDVVYTWVNGSDPRWKEEKDFWHKHWIASLTGQPLPKRSKLNSQMVQGTDVSNSDNRFRDNEELRYSLRSLEKYAPWIRHIYIVTDGQVPSWLNLESPRVSIVKHAEIFANQSHLPVFSSPSIESNLVNIPGLSESFLYFNDDVFLGSYVSPEDFISVNGVQKIYFAWEIPLCAPNCWDSWLQNGQCNAECNVTSCDFDMGDCGCQVFDNGTVVCDPASMPDEPPPPTKVPALADHICISTCHFRWLGDNLCDHSCNVSSCGWDGGDCGVDLLTTLPTAQLEATAPTLVQVPLDINATYLNLTQVFGANGSVENAIHTNERLIRSASLFEEQLSLLLVFGRTYDGDPMTAGAVVTVEGKDVNGTAIEYEFFVVRGNVSLASNATINETLNGFVSYDNASFAPTSIRLPLGFENATVTSIVLPVANSSTSEIQEEDTEDVAMGEEEANAQDSEREQSGGSGDSGSQSQEEDVDDESEPERSDDEDLVVSYRLAEVELLVPFSLARARSVNATEVIPTLEVKFRAHDSDDEVVHEFKHTCQASVPPLAPELSFAEQWSRLLNAVQVDADGMVRLVDPEQDQSPEKTEEAASTMEPDVTVSDPSEHAKEPEITIPGEDVNGDDAADKQEPHPSSDASNPDEPESKPVESQQGSNEAQHEQADDAEAIEQCLTAEDGVIFKIQVPVMKRGTNTSGVDDEHVLQVIDGQACFFNDMEKYKQKLCFTLAIGAFQPHQVVVAWPPPPSKDEEEEEDQVVISFVDRDGACVDVSLREMGLEGSSPICLENEQVIDFDALAEQDLHPEEPEEEDLAEKNKAEGRRVACEAKKRRLAEARGNMTALSRALGWVQIKLHPVSYALGFSTVEYVQVHDEDEDDEDDVCAPPGQQPGAPSAVPPSKQPDALLSKDTFGDSLRYVNKLYNRAFGKAATRRRVPSHMPFLIQKSVFNEMKSHWPAEFNATSSHRFRHPQDMQFSFSYFHYLINRHKLHSPTLQEIWHEYLDANRNGMLDESELLTVAAIANGDYPTQKFINDVKECLKPTPQEKTKEYLSLEGEVKVTETVTPFITLEQLQSCDWIVQKLLANVRKEKSHVLMSEEEVTFHMLSDQYSFAFNQMLGTRARRTKFVCINDDMKYPSVAVSNILHELFLAVWPKTSQFELPFHLRNRYAHIDDYKAAKRRTRTVLLAVVALLAMFLLALRKQIVGALFGEDEEDAWCPANPMVTRLPPPTPPVVDGSFASQPEPAGLTTQTAAALANATRDPDGSKPQHTKSE